MNERHTLATASEFPVSSSQVITMVPSPYLSTSKLVTVAISIVDSITGSETGDASVNSTISFPAESCNVIAYHDCLCSPNGT